MRPRAVLNIQQAIEIFTLRPNSDSQSLTAAGVGLRFGVNEKTVRDIWAGRTWSHATIHLLASDEPLPSKYRAPLRLGRPKGSRDTKPRKRRELSGEVQNLECGKVPISPNSSEQSDESSSKAIPDSLIDVGSECSRASATSDNQPSIPIKPCSNECFVSAMNSVCATQAVTRCSSILSSIDATLYAWEQERCCSAETSRVFIDPFSKDWPQESRQQ